MRSADEYRRLIIAYQNGAPVRLGDVAAVEQGRKIAGSAHGRIKAPAYRDIQRQPGANIVRRQTAFAECCPSTSLPKIGEGHGPVRSHHQ